MKVIILADGYETSMINRKKSDGYVLTTNQLNEGTILPIKYRNDSRRINNIWEINCS